MTAFQEPSRFTAGDTIAWCRELADYPANAGWVLSYTFINATAKFTATAAGDGAFHTTTIPAATSANYTAGDYTWQAVVTKSATSERYTVGNGVTTVAPNLAAATTLDTRSTAKKTLDAVNAAMLTYGAKAYLQGYEINGRKQQFHSPGEFLAFRSTLIREVAAEDNATRIAEGRRPRNQVAVRFNTR